MTALPPPPPFPPPQRPDGRPSDATHAAPPDPAGPPAHPGWAAPGFAPPKAPHATLPWQIGTGAVVVLVVSLLSSRFLLDWLVRFEWPIVAYVVVSVLLGYGPSVAWWWFSTRRWGSGHPVADVGGGLRWRDLAWGPVIWLAAIATQIAVTVVVLVANVPLSNNTDGIGELQADRAYVIATVIAAVVAAPLVEELVFRGLVLRSLLGRVAPAIAIVVQGVMFGIAHVDPVRGVGNVGLVIVLSGVGVAFGGFAHLLRRIGPTIVAHAIFNGVVMVLVLTGVADRLREENDPFSSAREQVAVVDQTYVAEPHGGGDAHRFR